MRGETYEEVSAAAKVPLLKAANLEEGGAGIGEAADYAKTVYPISSFSDLLSVIKE